MNNSKLQSKSLTTVIPNSKPVNTVAVPTVPAVTTTGGRRIRRVKKSRPGSLFSFAGKKVKSRKPKKVKSSHKIISLAGAKSRRYKKRSSKSRKSTGGKKIRRSKSRNSKKSKSKMTGGKRRHYKKY